MNYKQIADSIAFCGLVCGLCQMDNTESTTCDCHKNNHCGKLLDPGGCYQYDCCTQKGLNGCWECPDSPCGKDMHAESKIKIRAFIRCIKEDGLEIFSKYISRNLDNGIIYHSNGIFGDYDLDSEEDVLKLLRTGEV